MNRGTSLQTPFAPVGPNFLPKVWRVGLVVGAAEGAWVAGREAFEALPEVGLRPRDGLVWCPWPIYGSCLGDAIRVRRLVRL